LGVVYVFRSKSGRLERFSAIKIAAGVSLIAAFLMICLGMTVSVSNQREQQSEELSNAKQLALACKLYAGDNDHYFPVRLEELVPEYISDQNALNKLIYGAHGKGPGFDYFGGKETDAPDKVLLQSRAALHRKRVIVHVDLSLDIRRE